MGSLSTSFSVFVAVALAFFLAALIGLIWTVNQIRAVWHEHGEDFRPLLWEISLEALLLLTPFIIYIALGVPLGTPLHITQGPELPMASFLFASIAVLRLVRQRDQHATEKGREFGTLCAGVGILFAALSIIALAYNVLVTNGSGSARSLFNLGLMLFALQYYFAVLTVFGITFRTAAPPEE
jgi:hypothetical protein